MELLPQYTASTQLWYEIYLNMIKISTTLGQPLIVHPKDYNKMMEAKHIKEIPVVTN